MHIEHPRAAHGVRGGALTQRESLRVDAIPIPEPAGWDDPLTGLEGPDFWRRTLVAEVSRAARYRRSLAVVIVELDGIPAVAEAWGIEVARHALREAGQCIRRASRTSDYCTRIGMSRFGVVLTETDEIEAINFVERVRESGPRAMPKGTLRPAVQLRLGQPQAGRVRRRGREARRPSPGGRDPGLTKRGDHGGVGRARSTVPSTGPQGSSLQADVSPPPRGLSDHQDAGRAVGHGPPPVHRRVRHRCPGDAVGGQVRPRVGRAGGTGAETGIGEDDRPEAGLGDGGRRSPSSSCPTRSGDRATCRAACRRAGPTRPGPGRRVRRPASSPAPLAAAGCLDGLPGPAIARREQLRALTSSSADRDMTTVPSGAEPA